MSATDWGHLPNAVLIDWVISTLKTHPQDWGAARDAARGTARDTARDAAWDAAWGAAWGAARDAAWGAAWGTARDTARDAAWDAAWDAARDAARDAAWGATRGAARDAARDAARGACLVFVAYDDCADFLNFGQHTLQASYRLTDHPAFLLLQPAAIVWKQHGLKP